MSAACARAAWASASSKASGAARAAARAPLTRSSMWRSRSFIASPQNRLRGIGHAMVGGAAIRLARAMLAPTAGGAPVVGRIPARPVSKKRIDAAGIANEIGRAPARVVGYRAAPHARAAPPGRYDAAAAGIGDLAHLGHQPRRPAGNTDAVARRPARVHHDGGGVDERAERERGGDRGRAGGGGGG